MKTCNLSRRAAFLLSLLLVAVLFGTALSATAAETESAQATTVTTATVASDECGGIENDGALPSEETEEGETLPLSALFADFLKDNAASLLSAATFTLTMLVTLIFRKRIVPGILEALGGLLGKSREAVAAIEEGHVTERAEIERLLSTAEEMLSSAKEAAERAEGAAETILSRGTTDDELRRALGEQAALLYELLMAANLPQYQKDRIGALRAGMAAATEAVKKTHD